MEDNRAGVRALWVSLGALALTAALQLVVAALSGSVALLGDSLHNVADALTALPLWLAFSIGRRPPTRRFTYGFGRAEDVAGLAVVAMIAASAVLAGLEALDRLRHPRPVSHLALVAVAALVGMAGNEAVAVYRIRVGRRIGSAALVADGLHARSDAITSAAVLVGAAGTAVGWEWADPVVGLGISAAILIVFVQAARGVGERMMDAVDPGLVDDAEAVVAGVEGVDEVGELRIRWIGHRLHADVRVTVDRGLDVVGAHAIAEDVQHALLHGIDLLTGAVVHVDPSGDGDADPHAAIAHHRPGSAGGAPPH